MTAAHSSFAFGSFAGEGSFSLPRPTMRPVAVAEQFCDRTLQCATWLLEDTIWNIGVDQEATVRELTASLEADYTLIDRDIRDDDVIRDRATATLRRISAIFNRAHAFGLVEYGDFDPAAVSCPDYYDEITR